MSFSLPPGVQAGDNDVTGVIPKAGQLLTGQSDTLLLSENI